MGGQIDVESSPGAGSTFSVRLMLPSISTSVFDTENLNKTARQPSLVGYRGPRKTVLVVDDDLNHLTLTDHFLSNLGFVVLVASSADLAEQMLLEATPDLIILDIDMPERDGWSFAEDLRSGNWPNIPIIVISGHADEEGMSGPKVALHDAFLAKPFNLDDLLMQVAELLKVTLMLETEIDAAKPTQPDLTEADRAALLESAALGHAAGVRDCLQTLRSENRGSPGLLDLLEKRLDRFDMAGIAEALETTDHGV